MTAPNSQAAKRLVDAATRAQFPERIEQSQVLSIFLQNGFRFRKISDLLCEILDSASASVPEDVTSTYQWLQAQQLIRKDDTLDVEAAREALREVMRAKHAELSEVDDLNREIEEKERQLEALMQGNAENQQWMHKLHEKGRGRAAEQKHERAAASLAQAKSDLRATCAEVDSVLEQIHQVLASLYRSFHGRRAGMLVLFSDYRQLVEAQGRFQEALSRSQDAVREATSTQHRGSVLDTGEGRSRLLQDITSLTRAAPSAHLSFSLAKVRLAESEAARDVARDAVARAAQEHIREDRTGTAAGLEGTLELEGSAEHAAWEVPGLCQAIGQLEALPDVEAMFVSVISRLRADLRYALKALSFQHSQLARNLLLQAAVEAELQGIQRLSFFLHMLVKVLREHFDSVRARTETCKQIMSVPGNEAPLPGHGRPEAGTSFFLATVQALASAGESLKSFNQLVHADNHSLLQLTDQLYASSDENIRKAEGVLVETGLQACNTCCHFPEAATPIAQAQSEAGLLQRDLEALQDRWQKARGGNGSERADRGGLCRSTMLEFFR